MAIHGKDSAFLLEDSTGSTLRNIGPYLTSVDFSMQNDTHDTTTLGDEAHEYIAGLTNATITLNGFWDKTASVGAATVLDSLLGLDAVTVGFEYGPEGNTTTNVKYSGECVLQSLDYSSPVADLVTFTATLQVSGGITKGAFS